MRSVVLEEGDAIVMRLGGQLHSAIQEQDGKAVVDGVGALAIFGNQRFCEAAVDGLEGA